MGEPKLHHFVPQFHLRRFADDRGLLWVWDRDRDRVISATPKSIAAERHFYRLTEFAEHAQDPLTMEKQFANLEADAASITDYWLKSLREIKAPDKLDIPDEDRELVALHIALQFLRTADSREVLALFAESKGGQSLSAQEKRRLHMDTLWDERVYQALADRIEDKTWIFARNTTGTPFHTSDNPVAFRTGDNSMWLKVGIYTPGTYVVFPLAPDLAMYCHPKEPPWDKLGRFDCSLSPVEFTEEMVESENSGQVFMASRFVISPRNNFDHEREFAKTIGT